METIPISDEVSDLVQKLDNFYTEIDGDGEEAEEYEVDRRPFTRPFAQHAGNFHRKARQRKKKNTNQRGLCCSSRMQYCC